MTMMMKLLYVLLLLLGLTANNAVTAAFTFLSIPSNLLHPHARLVHTRLHLVSEEDVLKAVEKAEDLWAQALEARKTANALSDKAQEEAEAASETALEVETQMTDGTAISLEKLAAADRAAQTNVVAGGFVTKALDAMDKAEELEQLAEEALKASEAALEQHVLDFPDSPLAQEEEQ